MAQLSIHAYNMTFGTFKYENSFHFDLVYSCVNTLLVFINIQYKTHDRYRVGQITLHFFSQHSMVHSLPQKAARNKIKECFKKFRKFSF